MSCLPDSCTRSANFSKRLQTSGIDGRHVAESENNDWRQIGQTIDDRIEFVGCAKQKRAMDPENADVSRNLFVLQDMNMPFTRIYSAVTSDTVVVCVTFRMKTSTASIIPASTTLALAVEPPA